jgi:hypothetical protein
MSNLLCSRRHTAVEALSLLAVAVTEGVRAEWC